MLCLNLERVIAAAKLSQKGWGAQSLFLPLNENFVALRHKSTRTPNRTVHKPSKHLNFIENFEIKGPNHDDPKPLAIILGWYQSKPAHLMKFADFYLRLGFDVLFTSLRGFQILWPRTGSHVVASEILTFLGQNMRYESMLVHGFSGGGYLWGETMVKMVRNPDKYPDLRHLVKGHIWDSFVDWDGVPRGTAKAVFPNSRPLEKTVEFTLNTYGWIFYNQTTKHYQESSQHFHFTPIKSPVLYITSEDDPIAPFDAVKDSARRSAENGNKVFFKSWPSSGHVVHYRNHKEDYEREVLKFLQFAGLLTERQV